MANNSERDASNYWRDKYLALLDKYEQQEQTLSSRHEIMRRGLVVTSLLAEGQSLSADPLLHTVRSSLKNEANDLQETVEVLGKVVESFDRQRASQIEVILGQITDAADKLSKCPLPKPLLKRVRSIRLAAARELESSQGYHSQLQQWVQIIGDIASLPNNEEKTASPWWKQWFTAANSLSETTDFETENTNITPALSDFSNYAQDVTDTLDELLNQLDVPERLHSIHLCLKQRLESNLEVFDLVPLLEDTSSFVLDCLASNQVKIEEFLQNIDERLLAIRSLVNSANHNRTEHSQARLDLDELVRDQLSDIRSVVHGSTDLQQLSNNVKEHLELILQALEQYRAGEESREQAFKEQLRQLQQRLDEMEQEVNDKRLAFEEQRQKAVTDTLTGLPNREAYQQRVIDEHARFHRYGTPLSLIICDVDHFKHINDTYGHLAGDKVLQLIARLLQRNIREVDFICRYGGEEFIVLMPGTALDSAFQAAEKLRKAIEGSPFNFRKERVFITMSLGVAEFKPNELPDDVFERADKALYQSKSRGRNASHKG